MQAIKARQPAIGCAQASAKSAFGQWMKTVSQAGRKMVLVSAALMALSATAQTINETFSTSPATNFMTSGGTWTVSGGKFVLSNPASGAVGSNGNIAVHTSTLASGDWTLTAEATATASSSAWDDFSILFCYQNGTNYYYVSFNESDDANTSGVFKILGGVQSQLADIPSSPITAGTAYTVEVQKVGHVFTIKRNGALVATATDTAWTSGKVGFGTLNNAATFDNLVVTPASGGGTVAAPTFSPGGGTYTSAQAVTIATATSGASIRYTTNGTTPSPTVGTLYAGAVNIAATTTLKALAYKAGMTNSAVSSATYTINSSPGAFTHGSQITHYNVGARLGMYPSNLDTRPQATPTTMAGITHTSGTATYTNVIFTGRVRITGGTLILNNCWIQMPVGENSGVYGLYVDGGICEFEDLTVTLPNWNGKAIYVKAGGLKGHSFLVLGGADCIFVGNETSGTLPFPTYTDSDYPDFTGARVIMTDGYTGDRYRENSQHADNIQVDGGGRAIFKRINMQAHRILWPDTPPTAEWSGDPEDIGSAAFLLTQDSSNPKQIDRVGVYDCHLDGGNNVVDAGPSDGLEPTNIYLRGNTWGSSDPVTGGYVALYRFNPLSIGLNTVLSDNTWATTGTARQIGNANVAPADVPVTAGAAIPY